MNKLILIGMLLTLFCSCETKQNITEKNIFVVKVNPHPFLQDHERILKTVTQEGEIIDRESLRMDNG